MTNDREISPDLHENNQAENLSDLSLSSASEIHSPEDEKVIPNAELPAELHDQIDEVLHVDDDPAEDELTKFISKARREGFNCLDLSKKNISEFPQLLLAFPALQVIPSFSLQHFSLTLRSISICI